ncbi:unnamed protein product [Diamesa hyperborea]
MKFLVLALLICLIAVAFVSALPADESVFGDSIDNFNPSDDQEILKKLKIKKLLLLKKKLILG